MCGKSEIPCACLEITFVIPEGCAKFFELKDIF